ncbi:MAG: hypothetical protein WCK55_05110 [Verrucomicrobiota bacterium]
MQGKPSLSFLWVLLFAMPTCVLLVYIACAVFLTPNRSVGSSGFESFIGVLALFSIVELMAASIAYGSRYRPLSKAMIVGIGLLFGSALANAIAILIIYVGHH